MGLGSIRIFERARWEGTRTADGDMRFSVGEVWARIGCG